MLPDPLALRGAATALTSTSTEVRRLCAELATTLTDMRWAAPAVDVVRRGLATAEADGLTGALGVAAGATHLLALATTIEDLQQATRRLHAQAADNLRAQAAAATTPAQAEEAARLLAALKDPDDPSWARVAQVRAVAVPGLVRAPERPVPPSPAGIVEANLADLGWLSERCRTSGSAVTAACGSLRARVGGLGLSGLDAYGLAGSRSAEWLTAPAGPLAGAADRWALAARECDLLFRLLATADRPGEVLSDPRLAEAFGVLEAQLRGPAALQAALGALSPADRSWVADLVPGLAAPQEAPGGGWHLSPLSPLDRLGWVHDFWQGLPKVAEEFDRRVADLWREATSLRDSVRGLGGAAEAEGKATARELMREATRLRNLSGPWLRVPSWLHPPAWLRAADDAPLWEKGFGGLSRLGGLFTVLGVVWDVTHGMSVPAALTKAAVMLAVSVGIVAFAAFLVEGAGVTLALFGEVAITLVLGYLASTVYDWLAPIVGHWLAGVGSALVRTGKRVAARAEQELTRQAERVGNQIETARRTLGDVRGRVEDRVRRFGGLRLPGLPGLAGLGAAATAAGSAGLRGGVSRLGGASRSTAAVSDAPAGRSDVPEQRAEVRRPVPRRPVLGGPVPA